MFAVQIIIKFKIWLCSLLTCSECRPTTYKVS